MGRGIENESRGRCKFKGEEKLYSGEWENKLIKLCIGIRKPIYSTNNE